MAAAFENSQSELVELNEARDKLRRTSPYEQANEEAKKELNLRTIHFRGFPKENTTLDELIEYCSQYGEVEHVNMRRLGDKTFKVSDTEYFRFRETLGQSRIELTRNFSSPRAVVSPSTKISKVRTRLLHRATSSKATWRSLRERTSEFQFDL